MLITIACLPTSIGVFLVCSYPQKCCGQAGTLQPNNGKSTKQTQSKNYASNSASDHSLAITFSEETAKAYPCATQIGTCISIATCGHYIQLVDIKTRTLD